VPGDQQPRSNTNNSPIDMSAHLKDLDQFKEYGAIILREYLLADKELAMLEAMNSPGIADSINKLELGSSANSILLALLASLLSRVWAIGLDEHRSSASLHQCKRLLQNDEFVNRLRAEYSASDESLIVIIEEDPLDSIRTAQLKRDIASERTAGLAFQFKETIDVLNGDFLPSLLDSHEAKALRAARNKVMAHKDMTLSENGMLRLSTISDYGIRLESIRLLMTKMRKAVSEIFLISNRGYFVLDVSERNHRAEALKFWSCFAEIANNANKDCG
jgi:hypothetical protein